MAVPAVELPQFLEPPLPRLVGRQRGAMVVGLLLLLLGRTPAPTAAASASPTIIGR